MLKKSLLCFLILIGIVFTLILTIHVISLNYQNEAPTQLSPKTGKFVQVAGQNIFIQEVGEKKENALIFIHGTGSWSQLWIPSMTELAKHGHYSVAIDLAPFGFSHSQDNTEIKYDRLSQAEIILAVIDKLNIKKYGLICHSFGARAALTAAVKRPEQLERLILVSSALGFGNSANQDPAPAGQIVTAIIQNNFLRKTIVSLGTLPQLTKKLVSLFVASEDSLTPEIVEMYQRPLRMLGKNDQISSWIKSFLLLIDNELISNKELFKNLNVPVAIIWGEKDTVTPSWQAYEIQKRFSQASLVIIKNVGHIPMIENETQFMTELLKSTDQQIKSN